MGLFSTIAEAAQTQIQAPYTNALTAAGINLPDVKASLENGVLTVSGTVPDGETAEKVVAALQATAGVTSVTNLLEVEDLTDKNIFMLVATKSSNLNIRKGPGTEHEIVGKAAHGDKVQLIKKMFNGWYFIHDSDSQEGFCSTDYLEEVAAEAAPAVTPAP